MRSFAGAHRSRTRGADRRDPAPDPACPHGTAQILLPSLRGRPYRANGWMVTTEHTLSCECNERHQQRSTTQQLCDNPLHPDFAILAKRITARVSPQNCVTTPAPWYQQSEQLGGPPASRNGGAPAWAAQAVESRIVRRRGRARDRIKGNGRLRCARGDGRRQEAGSARRVRLPLWVIDLCVCRALDDFCSGPLFLTCNALGQTAVMPGHLVEYNSSIAGEE